jgi:hypothetical protein
VRHAGGDGADAAPGVEPVTERVERGIARRSAQVHEAEGCTEDPATSVEHTAAVTALGGLHQVPLSISLIFLVLRLTSFLQKDRGFDLTASV